MHQFLQDNDLAAANTFQVCHSGASHTWVSAHGTTRRLDYVCLPAHWLASTRTSVAAHFELLQARDDHYPVLARCSVQKDIQHGSFRPPPRRRAMRPGATWESGHTCSFLSGLAIAPTPDWSVDVEEHFSHGFLRIMRLGQRSIRSSRSPLSAHM